MSTHQLQTSTLFLDCHSRRGIARASERLHITPKTISGQLSLLDQHFNIKSFNKVGRNLETTEIGKQILNYANEIFSLGGELERMVCREADLDTLLADLTLHRLDLVIADRPIPPTVSTRRFSHKSGQCAIIFLLQKHCNSSW